jgi:hypothetical protein
MLNGKSENLRSQNFNIKDKIRDGAISTHDIPQRTSKFSQDMND